MCVAAEEKLGCAAHTELGLRAQAAALEVLPYLDIVCAERLQQNVVNAPSGLRRQQRPDHELGSSAAEPSLAQSQIKQRES